ATLLTGLVGSLGAMLFARVILGFGEGATFPTATRAMSDWTPEGSRGFAQGITHSSARLGNALTPPLVAWLITVMNWRGSFVILGIVSLAWAVVWVAYFRDDPAAHPPFLPLNWRRCRPISRERIRKNPRSPGLACRAACCP
ncbi:MAG TPA: MFS transporter, partial [Candidatus Acidoferrales bacterium]